METLSLIIVDDEANARELLAGLVSEIPGFEIVASCDGVDSAFQEISEILPDAVFLDIQMPRQDGFVLAEMLRSLEKIPEIIFITAFEKFSIQAIRAAAFDYLLKPVKKEELRSTLCRLRSKMRQQKQKERLDQLMENVSLKNKIRINDRHGFHLIDPGQIIYVTADGSYCKIFLSDGRELMMSMNIGKAEQLFTHDQFFKISRSCIININFLIRVDRKKMVCELQNDKVYLCPVSKPYIKNLEERICR